MGLAADAAEIAKAGVSGPELDELGAMVMLAGYRNLIDTTALGSLSKTLGALQEPEGKGKKFISGMIKSFVEPALLTQTASLLDPAQREVRTFADTLKSGIPFYRNTLQPKVDIWGREIPEASFGITRRGNISTDPIDVLMDRLKMKKSDPERKLGGIELTPEQYHDYAVIGGQLAKKRLDDLLPTLMQVPDARKMDMISETIDKARHMAGVQVKMGSLGTDNDIVSKEHQQRVERLNQPVNTVARPNPFTAP
jgi:hypothetical protein